MTNMEMNLFLLAKSIEWEKQPKKEPTQCEFGLWFTSKSIYYYYCCVYLFVHITNIYVVAAFVW